MKQQGTIWFRGLQGNQGTCLSGKLKLKASSVDLWVAGAGVNKQRNCLTLFGFCCIQKTSLVPNSGKSCSTTIFFLAVGTTLSILAQMPHKRHKSTDESIWLPMGKACPNSSYQWRTGLMVGGLHPLCTHYEAGTDRSSKPYVSDLKLRWLKKLKHGESFCIGRSELPSHVCAMPRIA